MSNEEQKKEIAEVGISEDERKISQMLGNLRIIDAPKDFDFRLKARIANGASANSKSIIFLPVFKYGLPLCALLLIAAFFALNGFYTVDERNVPSIAETSVPSTAEFIETAEIKNQAPASPTAPNNPPSINTDESATLSSKKAKSKIVKRTNSSKRSAGSSVDRALKGLSKTILPPRETTPNQLSVQEIFSSIGTEAEFKENSWKIKAVKKNSLAERSGVKTDDAVEAIDDRPLDERSVYNGKTLRVRRDNKVLDIKLPDK